MGDLTFALPLNVDLDGLTFDGNATDLVLSANFDDGVQAQQTDPAYEQFLADVWVGIVLTLMVLSCVCCMCSCLLYHKFQQWKRSVLEARNAANLEAGNHESESLPSYTIVSGLPSYEEALEQLKKVKELRGKQQGSEAVAAAATASVWVPRTPPTPVHRLSATDLYQLYQQRRSSDGKGNQSAK